jgi:hypothetical protein
MRIILGRTGLAAIPVPCSGEQEARAIVASATQELKDVCLNEFISTSEITIIKISALLFQQ